MLSRILLTVSIAAVGVAGCTTGSSSREASGSQRPMKTVEHNVRVQLPDGSVGTITRSEIDLADFASLMEAVAGDRVDKPPKALAMPVPIYPRVLLNTRIEGFARVVFLVDERGLVEDVRVTKASHPEFGLAAASAVSMWRFEPMTRGGKPAKVAFEETFPFKLQ